MWRQFGYRIDRDHLPNLRWFNTFLLRYNFYQTLEIYLIIKCEIYLFTYIYLIFIIHCPWVASNQVVCVIDWYELLIYLIDWMIGLIDYYRHMLETSLSPSTHSKIWESTAMKWVHTCTVYHVGLYMTYSDLTFLCIVHVHWYSDQFIHVCSKSTIQKTVSVRGI